MTKKTKEYAHKKPFLYKGAVFFCRVGYNCGKVLEKKRKICYNNKALCPIGTKKEKTHEKRFTGFVIRLLFRYLLL